MVEAVLLLVLGGVVGVVVERAVKAAGSVVSASTQQRRRRRYLARRHPDRIASFLAEYFARLDADLYQTTHVCPGETITILPFRSEAGGHSLEFDISLASADRRPFPVKDGLIQRRRDTGQHIFDGDLAYVHSFEATGGRVEMHVGMCSYLAWASGMMEIEDEISRAARRRQPTPKFDATVSSWESAIACRDVPVSVGCAAVTLFNIDGSMVMPMHRRSSAVMVHPGRRAIVPTFGIESNTRGGLTSRHPLLLHNYLREFGEELLNLEGLIHASRSTNLSPDWFLSLPPIAEVEAQFIAGQASLHVTGIAIDPQQFGVVIAGLAVFESEDFSRGLVSMLQANWEADHSEGSALELVGLFDSRVDAWLEDGTLGHGYVIDRARAYVTGLRD